MTGGTKCGPSSSSAAFVSKISADGQSLIYSTYLGGGGPGPGTGGASVSQGGSGSDFGTGIAVDAHDNAWVVGQTNSNNFPVTADAYSLYCEPATLNFNFNTDQNDGELSSCARFNGGSEYNYSGTYSLFLVKLNPTGTSILYGTFLGGTQGEMQAKVALDVTGNIYVSGSVYTASVGTPAATGQFNFPTTSSAFQTAPQQNAWSAFITEFAPSGHSLLYSSYLSATVGQSFGGALALGGGKIFIGGYNQTPSFPTTAGALSTTCPGNSPTQCPNNGWVAEFDSTKSGAASLVFSTYLNGSHVSSAGIGESTSMVSALAADAAGNVYAAGSNQYKDFPTTPGVLQPTCNSTHNDSCGTGFVTKLSPAGSLVWSTFFGSPSASGQFGVSAIALDSGNNVYITNNADGAGDMPLPPGFQNYTSGVAYVAELSSDASQVLFGSFYGSGANINPTGIATDAQGNVYLTGYTAGALPLVSAFQSTNGGGFNEGFFAKIATGLPSPPSCNYQLNLAGEGFPAPGGSGTILITAGANCPWSVGSLPAGVTLTSPASGTGNGTVTFVVAANSGGDLTNTLVIAGQAFTIEQEAAALSGLNFIGSMPHLAAEENWTTAFTLVNKGTATATARLSLFGDAVDPTGNGPLTLPLAFPQSTAAVSALQAASFDNAMPAKSSLIVNTAGSQTPPVLVGSAQLSATGTVDGFAIFHLIPGAQEAVVPMETRNASSYLLAFDNTGGVVLGVAVENVSTQSGNIGIVIRDDTGTIISAPSTTISLAGNGHTSFVLSQQYPITAAIRGTIEFDTPSGGRISVLGIRTTPEGTSNTLTTIPALASVGTGGGSIAHLATGNGWQTTFVLVNTGAASAEAHLKFFADNGTPLSLPLAFPQAGGGSSTTAATLDRTLPAGASLIVQSAAPLSDPAPTIGSAQLTTDGNVGGFVIFRFNPNGQEAVVPLESRNATGYILAFDNTAGTATGVAINAVATQTVNIPVIVRDDTGLQIATDTIALAANGHLAFTLAVDKYPVAANIRGTVEFDTPASAQIGALGIRIPVAHTFTTLPALVK
jgi:Beta-propeller repeat